MKKSKYLGLPDETKVEIIGFSGGKVFKKTVSLKEANEIKLKKPGTIIYQLGYSQFKNVINI